MPELREIIPRLTPSQIAALKTIDGLRDELVKNHKFRSELAADLEKRGQITIRASFRCKSVERAVRLMHAGTPEVKANANRAIENIVLYLVIGGIEEAAENGK